jgi:hypothetical protein
VAAMWAALIIAIVGIIAFVWVFKQLAFWGSEIVVWRQRTVDLLKMIRDLERTVDMLRAWVTWEKRHHSAPWLKLTMTPQQCDLIDWDAWDKRCKKGEEDLFANLIEGLPEPYLPMIEGGISPELYEKVFEKDPHVGGATD